MSSEKFIQISFFRFPYGLLIISSIFQISYYSRISCHVCTLQVRTDDNRSFILGRISLLLSSSCDDFLMISYVVYRHCKQIS